MTKLLSILLFSICIFYACVGDDYIDDMVEPSLKITNALKSIAKDTSFQLEYSFTNNIGLNEDISIDWSSSEMDIASINSDGVLHGISNGITIISLDAQYQGENLQDTIHLSVSEETIEVPQEDNRKGSLSASSFYDLEGDFILEKVGNTLILNFDNNYNADTGLPGLYVYLTNNPNSVNGAFVIGPVETFSGSHSYEIDEDIDLFEYSHVLYFCKPFNVKVGDGSLSE